MSKFRKLKNDTRVVTQLVPVTTVFRTLEAIKQKKTSQTNHSKKQDKPALKSFSVLIIIKRRRRPTGVAEF